MMVTTVYFLSEGILSTGLYLVYCNVVLKRYTCWSEVYAVGVCTGFGQRGI